MGFWTTTAGEATGESERANFSEGFDPLPNKTLVTASFQGIEKKFADDGSFFYKITWKVVSPNYAGRLLWQSLRVNHEDVKKRDRAKEMLARIFLMAQAEKPADEPTEMDFMRLGTFNADLRVMLFNRDDGEGVNWISAVKKATNMGAYDVNNMQASSDVNPDEDLPF